MAKPRKLGIFVVVGVIDIAAETKDHAFFHRKGPMERILSGPYPCPAFLSEFRGLLPRSENVADLVKGLGIGSLTLDRPDSNEPLVVFSLSAVMEHRLDAMERAQQADVIPQQLYLFPGTEASHPDTAQISKNSLKNKDSFLVLSLYESLAIGTHRARPKNGHSCGS